MSAWNTWAVPIAFGVGACFGMLAMYWWTRTETSTYRERIEALQRGLAQHHPENHPDP